MTSHLHENAAVWDSESEAFISSKHQHMAQVLNDYNPYFNLVWIPPKDRDATDSKPFAIRDSSPGRPPYIVRYLSVAEMDDPAQVIAWVWEGDLSKHRPVDVFEKMEMRRKAEEAMVLRERDDELQDILDFGAFAFGNRSPHFMKHNGQTYRK